ncbi:phosphoinositide phospholipase C [Powellomyces hirtus]|uniref:Phosphoinositide phospholipase C n=1 Tax=Powellomyces hirtus TaxID=109895 RepID=A0A507EE94_9FUNG|nr:phosphoinositide phospholipase C [Powellomyces hirtus]
MIPIYAFPNAGVQRKFDNPSVQVAMSGEPAEITDLTASPPAQAAPLSAEPSPSSNTTPLEPPPAPITIPNAAATPISPRPTSLTFTESTLCSGVAPPPILPLDPQHLERVLTAGTRMIKYPSKSKSKPAERLIRVDLSSMQIFWESKKKKSNHRSVDLHSIKEIRLGQNTKGFEIHGKRPDQADRSFSVIYVTAGEYKMLNLVAPSREDAALWISGLHMLIAQADMSGGDPAKLSASMGTWLRKQWNEADESKDGKLDLDEVTDLFKKLNIRLSKSEIKSTFKMADIDKHGHLSFTAFERLYRVLRFRPEVSELFSVLSKTKQPVITIDEFKEFVLVTQKNDWTEERCLDVYNKYASEGGKMNVDHFSAFLLSATNSIFKKAHTQVFQDMTLPLTDYFINTSHNTYLLKDQLTGESSVEGYIRALQRGCRCVELDCYDGPNGSPVIYHGGTLVGKLLFKDVIEAIVRYAFVATPYPLTLSLESHCGPEQQAVMASVLTNVLGDYVIRKSLTEGETALPSPEALKNKIIIKGKIFPPGGEGDTDNEAEDEDDQSPLQQTASLTDVGTAPMVARPAARRGISYEEGDQITRRRNSDEDQLPSLNRKKSSPKMSRKYVVAKPLQELLVYCKGVHFSTFAYAAEKFPFDYMCSLSEKKSLALMQRQRREYMQYTSRWLTRIYPAGIRVTSSNYDPIPHWAVGAQMVAMNVQTWDRGMQLNNALFMLNGRCGYVLKPPSLRAKVGEVVEKTRPVVLKIKIISGQQLPKPKDSTGSTVIDPYIEVEIAGSEADNAKSRTRTISNNGFNPMWKEEFKFVISDPQLALLRFTIFDMDVALTSDLIGGWSVPVMSLEQGYRHVPVYNWKGDLIRFSSLFIHVDVEEVGGALGGEQSPSASTTVLSQPLQQQQVQQMSPTTPSTPPPLATPTTNIITPTTATTTTTTTTADPVVPVPQQSPPAPGAFTAVRDGFVVPVRTDSREEMGNVEVTLVPPGVATTSTTAAPTPPATTATTVLQQQPIPQTALPYVFR